MGHHNKKTHARKMTNVWQTAEVSDTGMAGRSFCYITSLKIQTLNLCSLLGVKDSFTQLSDHCNLAESFLIRVS